LFRVIVVVIRRCEHYLQSGWLSTPWPPISVDPVEEGDGSALTTTLRRLLATSLASPLGSLSNRHGTATPGGPDVGHEAAKL
jgi:hypothetical protein